MGRIRDRFRIIERRFLRALMSLVAAIADRRVERHLEKAVKDEKPDSPG